MANSISNGESFFLLSCLLHGNEHTNGLINFQFAIANSKLIASNQILFSSCVALFGLVLLFSSNVVGTKTGELENYGCNFNKKLLIRTQVMT